MINLLNAQTNAESESDGEAEWTGLANFSNSVDNQSSLEIVSDKAISMKSMIQVELENDYLYHCQAIDLTLSLWITGDDKLIDEELDELELLPVS